MHCSKICGMICKFLIALAFFSSLPFGIIYIIIGVNGLRHPKLGDCSRYPQNNNDNNIICIVVGSILITMFLVVVTIMGSIFKNVIIGFYKKYARLQCHNHEPIIIVSPI